MVDHVHSFTIHLNFYIELLIIFIAGNNLFQKNCVAVYEPCLRQATMPISATPTYYFVASVPNCVAKCYRQIINCDSKRERFFIFKGLFVLLKYRHDHTLHTKSNNTNCLLFSYCFLSFIAVCLDYLWLYSLYFWSHRPCAYSHLAHTHGSSQCL